MDDDIPAKVCLVGLVGIKHVSPSSVTNQKIRIKQMLNVLYIACMPGFSLIFAAVVHTKLNIMYRFPLIRHVV